VKDFYSKSRLIKETEFKTFQKSLEEEDLTMLLTDEEKQFVCKYTETIPKKLENEFEKRYKAWEKTWDEFPIAASSNPGDYAKSAEFYDLIALGAEIIPLIMKKLLDPDQFFALQALKYLAREELIFKFELDDPMILEGEQGRAAQTVRRWLSFM
jgi:hypothetical protein